MNHRRQAVRELHDELEGTLPAGEAFDLDGVLANSQGPVLGILLVVR